MKYHLDLFTPETWQTFNEAGASITGFRTRQRRLAEERVKSGDIFLCYLTRLSRWCGALEVESGPYFDDSPIFDNPDPYHVRFKVKPIALLEPELAIPIRDSHVCNCSDLMGSEAIFACSVRSLQHKLSVAERLRPLKREQLRTFGKT